MKTCLIVLLAAIGMSGFGAVPNIRPSTTLNTAAEVANFRPRYNETIRVMGYYTPGDIAPVELLYDPTDTTTPTNGLMVMMPSSGIGRLKAAKPATGYWSPEHFGARGTGLAADGDDGPAVRAAFAANSSKLYPPLRSYYIDLSQAPIINGVRVGLYWGITPATASNRFDGPKIVGSGMYRTSFIFGGASGAGLVFTGIPDFTAPHAWTASAGPYLRQPWFYGELKNLTLQQSITDTNQIWNYVDYANFWFDVDNLGLDYFNTTWDRPAMTFNQCWNMAAKGIYIEGASRTEHGIQIFNANQQKFDVFTHGFKDSTNSYSVKADNAESFVLNLQDQAKTEFGFLAEAIGNKGNTGPWRHNGYVEGPARPVVFRRGGPNEVTLVGSNSVTEISSIVGAVGPTGLNDWATATLPAPWVVYDGQFVTIAGISSDAAYNGLLEVLFTSGNSFTYQLTTPWVDPNPTGASIVATQWLAVATSATPHRNATRGEVNVSGASEATYNGTFLVGFTPDPFTAVLLLDGPYTDPNPTGTIMMQGDSWFAGVECTYSGFNGAGGQKNSSEYIPRHFFEGDYIRNGMLNISHASTRPTRPIFATNILTATNAAAFVVTNTITTAGAHNMQVGDHISWRTYPSANYPGTMVIDSVPATNQIVGRTPSYRATNKGTVNEMIQVASYGILLGTNTFNVEVGNRPYFDTQNANHWYRNMAPEPWFTRDRTTWLNKQPPVTLISISNATSDTTDTAYTASLYFNGSLQPAWALPLYPKTIKMQMRYTFVAVGASGRVVSQFGRMGDVSSGTGGGSLNEWGVYYVPSMVTTGQIVTFYIEIPVYQSDGHFTHRMFVTSGVGWNVSVQGFQVGATY